MMEITLIHDGEAYLEPSRTCAIEIFWKNSWRLNSIADVRRYNFIVSCSNCFENFVVIVSDSVGFAREILATLQKMLSTKGSLLGWLRQQENSSYQDNSFKDLKWLIVWYMQAAILQKLNYKKLSALSPFVISDHVEF